MSTTEEILQQIEQMLDDMDRSARAPERPTRRPEPGAGDEQEVTPPEAPPTRRETPRPTEARLPTRPVTSEPAPVTLPEPALEPAMDPQPEDDAPDTLAPEPAPEILTVRGRRRTGRLLRALARELRFLGILVLAFALGSGGAFVYRALDRGGATGTAGPGSAPPPEQHVATWVVWPHETRDAAFATVLASGGGRDPLALVVPPYLAVNIPGQGLGTLEEAGESRDRELMATTVGNVIQVPVDAALGSGPPEIMVLVDAVGGVDSPEGRLDGAGAAEYLAAKVDPSDRFIRWQEVLSGILEGIAERPSSLGSAPAALRRALSPLAGPGRTVLELPVRDIGADLADVDDAELRRLVAERFVRPGTTVHDVRLLVLNAHGRPGIGADVARLLVPVGFRLVSSQNASSFGQKETLIVASTKEFLDEAELARRTLGVGEVVLGEQPTRVTDVSVIVGRDFRRR
ncbi:MAG TPA: LytR C-terminal domain-containing protein [Actinomycetota bacterium]|nr:LytR C-terminal domain-containing protein [Actinomycetota bacterium]